MSANNEKILDVYVEAVSPVLASEGEQSGCRNHPETAADAVCESCGEMMCWSCTRFDVHGESLLCESCLQNQRETRTGQRVLSLARKPYVYVLLIVAVALVCYVRGVGNPGPEQMQQADADDPWWQQRAGRLWLQQGGRAKRRTVYLFEHGDSGAARRWAKLEHSAFRKVRAYWAEEPVALDLAVAEAVALHHLGEPGKGHELLASERASEMSGHPSYLPVIYHRGKLALASGRLDAALEDWETVLGKTTQANMGEEARRQLDTFIDAFSGGPQHGVLVMTVRGICGTMQPGTRLRDNVISRLAEDELLGRVNQDLLTAEERKRQRQPVSDSSADEFVIERFGEE